MSAKGLDPPPELLAFFKIICINIYFYFILQEKPEMDEFQRKKNFGSNGEMFLMDTHGFMEQFHKLFLYSFVSEHCKHFFFDTTCIF